MRVYVFNDGFKTEVVGYLNAEMISTIEDYHGKLKYVRTGDKFIFTK